MDYVNRLALSAEWGWSRKNLFRGWRIVFAAKGVRLEWSAERSQSRNNLFRGWWIVFRGKESSAHSITQQLTELTNDGWLSAVAGRINIRRFLGGIRIREETVVWLILLFGVASGRVGLMLAKNKCTRRR
jgi:hypothetical protein